MRPTAPLSRNLRDENALGAPAPSVPAALARPKLSRVDRNRGDFETRGPVA